MSVKEDFHQLIDSINDEETLESYYRLIEQINNAQAGEFWNELTEDQKADLLKAYEESFDQNQLISHEEAKRQHKRWLKE